MSVTFNDREIGVDEGLVALLGLLWSRGAQTEFSCQGDDAEVPHIGFADAASLAVALGVLVELTDGSPFAARKPFFPMEGPAWEITAWPKTWWPGPAPADNPDPCYYRLAFGLDDRTRLERAAHGLATSHH